MKHHAKGRPVGKCKGCCLNLRTFCAGGHEPKTQWSRGRCANVNDEFLLEKYYQAVELTGAKRAREVRRAKAVQTAGVTRMNGQLFIPARRTVLVPQLARRGR